MRIEEAIKQGTFESEQAKLIVNLIYTGNWIISVNAAALKPFGLTTQQFNVMRILKGQHPNPVPVSLIGDRMLDRMSNASRLVEKLRQKGVVARRICKTDRRQVDVQLTKEGLELLEKANTAVKETILQLGNVSDKDAAKMNELLDHIRTNGMNID
jgi:DNA-binding MarR family transcriptional regulator